jgi:hypothetical protein
MSAAPPPAGGRAAEPFQIAAIRADMIKIQQAIQRQTSQYEKVISYVPPRLPQLMSRLKKSAAALQPRVQAEVSFDYDGAIGELEQSIAALDSAFGPHVQATRTALSKDPFMRCVAELESSVARSNDTKFGEFRARLDAEVSRYEASMVVTEPEKIPLHLTAQIREDGEESEIEVVYVEATARVSPDLTWRVRRHADRVRKIEAEIDSRLAGSGRSVSGLPLMVRQLTAISAANRAMLEGLEAKYDRFEAPEPAQQTTVAPQTATPPVAVDRASFAAFKKEVVTPMWQLSSEITRMTEDMEDDIEPFAGEILEVQRRLNKFEECAASLAGMIRLAEEQMIKIKQQEAENRVPSPQQAPLDLLVKEGISKLNEFRYKTEKDLKRIEQEISDLSPPDLPDLTPAPDATDHETAARANPGNLTVSMPTMPPRV